MRRLTNILIMMTVLLMGALHTGAAKAQKAGSVVCDTVSSFTNINFRLKSTVLDLDYRGNEQSIDSLKSVLDSIGMNDIVSIEIVSMASPEGNYSLNQSLSKGRGEAMNSYICSVWDEYCGLINLTPAGESWGELREYVEADTVLSSKTIEKVLSVIDADINVTTKKWRMENTLGSDVNVGDVYAYLYKKYYPIIRNVGINVVYLSYRTVEEEMTETEDNTNMIPVIGTSTESDSTVVSAIEAIDGQDSATDESESSLLGTVLDNAASAAGAAVSTAVSALLEREPMLSIKTNLLYDAVVIPGQGYRPILNGILEYYPRHSNWTALFEYDAPWYSNEADHFYFQAINAQLEARRYFTNDFSHNGFYASAYVAANLYDFNFDTTCDMGKQGEGASFGFGFGWVKPISKNGKWKIELSGKAGFYESHYDNYHAGNPFGGKYYYNWDGDNNDFIRRNWRFRWFGPTGVGVTLSYDIFDRKVK